MGIIMKFSWVPITGALLITLVHAATTTEPTTTTVHPINKQSKGTEEVAEKLTLEELEAPDNLPILPPLILLDFTNDTNSTSGDEKTKRTVNDNLGYGFQSNNFFAGRKANYYFPSGKSGTTVSIEESITPFLPRTIIERTKPVLEKSEVDAKTSEKTHGFKSQHYSTIQPYFGQRTKLHGNHRDLYDFSKYPTTVKPSVVTTTQKPADGIPTSPYRGFYSVKPVFSPSSTQRSIYSTQAPAVSTTLSPPFNNFGTPKSASSTLNPVVSEQFYHPVKTLPPESQSSYSEEKPVHASALSGFPKYTYENGVKYEHRIVWKYPDGRVSQDPPSSYVNSYAEYDSMSRPVSYSFHSDHTSKLKDYDYNYMSNLRYQGPMLFPKDSEPVAPKQTPFVKPVSVDAIRQKNVQFYQNSPSKYSVPKLEVGSSNPEYLPPAVDGSSKEQVHFPDLLSKYSSDTQTLLQKVLSPSKESYDGENSGPNYANLLNYNPSISQYIKNPSSILNAQPTFIQAGNSLIPVIILRVDGAPPVQQKPASSINLKALLQQYISQYATSVSDLSQGTNYNFDDEELDTRYQDPHYDLKKLTDTLKQISHHTSPRPSIAESVTDSYGNVLGGEYKSLADSRRNLPYNLPYKKMPKVKNVQIVDDPRFPKLKDTK